MENYKGLLPEGTSPGFAMIGLIGSMDRTSEHSSNIPLGWMVKGVLNGMVDGMLFNGVADGTIDGLPNYMACGILDGMLDGIKAGKLANIFKGMLDGISADGCTGG